LADQVAVDRETPHQGKTPGQEQEAAAAVAVATARGIS
jgi:hypothetical protein